ncbi:DUF1405 domain-containing protein [Bacillus testis]|uniref:DUF1405 domain-containing protein n=1 Tax=Bacillus testis TaxID=1622072 RepID=UPI00067F41F8|nr:DUF1405 domain-containing protein [Bacillus testis]
MNIVYAMLRSKPVLWLLLVVNILGTIYGYYWYKDQLAYSKLVFIPFIPDSPTACLFFVFVLVAFLSGKNWGLFEALAMVSLFKYGIWAVLMNLFMLIVEGSLHWTGYMLMASHFAMALQGLLYAPFYRIKAWHLMVAAVFTLHNEIIDYVFLQMPWYGELELYIKQIGYATFWLSILSIFICYYVGMKKPRWKLTM